MVRVLLVMLFGGSAVALAFYSAEANKVANFAEICKTVVLVPIQCPPDIDCLWLERELGQLIREKSKLKVVDADRVRRAVFDLGLTGNEPDFRPRVLERLGADAAVVVGVPGVDTTTKGTTAVLVGNAFVTAPQERKTGVATLEIVDRDGKRLMQGSGHGDSRSPYRSEKGLVAKVLRLILERAFPA